LLSKADIFTCYRHVRVAGDPTVTYADVKFDDGQSTEYTAKMRRAPGSQPLNLPVFNAVYAWSNVSKIQWAFVDSFSASPWQERGECSGSAEPSSQKITTSKPSSCLFNGEVSVLRVARPAKIDPVKSAAMFRQRTPVHGLRNRTKSSDRSKPVPEQ
jgi:hypothetical protein